jgi:hypothetical protein
MCRLSILIAVIHKAVGSVRGSFGDSCGGVFGCRIIVGEALVWVSSRVKHFKFERVGGSRAFGRCVFGSVS